MDKYLSAFQPYLVLLSATISITTLGFILNLLRAIRDNAQDRIAVQEERLKKASDDQQRTEKWAEREKAALKDELAVAKASLDRILQDQGLDLSSLSLGKQLSESAGLVRETAEALVQEMQAKLAQLADLQGSIPNNHDMELSVAMGAMSTGSFSDAAAHFDTYARAEDDSWEANLARGVAHANARGGRDSNIASLRAYNEAIAMVPIDIDDNFRARMFAYRGAILKRLNRLSEAEADLRYALTMARDRYELTDIHYNLACIHAMRGEKDHMLAEIEHVKSSASYMRAIRAHRQTYFANFAGDPDFLRALA